MTGAYRLLNWLFSGRGTYIEYFIGKREINNCKKLCLINSNELVVNQVENYILENPYYQSNSYHQVFFYVNNENSIINKFNLYSEELSIYTHDIVLIRENLFANEKLKRKKILVKENDILISPLKKRMFELFKIYGTFVICKLHSFILMNLQKQFEKMRIFHNDFELTAFENINFQGQIKYKKYHHNESLKRFQLKKIKLIGQFNKEMILVKIKQKVYIIDQHALHERILLEKMLRNTKQINLEIAKETACKNAIKFGMKLTKFKMKEMINWIEKLKYPFICCYGRPSIVSLGFFY